MQDIEQLREFYKLKAVSRFNTVEGRKESSAEHSWSCLMLADYFVTRFNYDLDRLKVYELLMYHDVVEVEAGDTVFHPNMPEVDKGDLETQAAKILATKLPAVQGEKFKILFAEYDACTTKEAKFAKCIDALDPAFTEMPNRAGWKGWSAQFLIDKKGYLFEEFPEMKQFFLDFLEYLTKKGYFGQ